MEKMSGSPETDGRAADRGNVEKSVVRLKNLSLSYGRTPAIDNISLEIPARKLVGLIGPDGVGKSTLLSLITGCHVLQQGELEVLDGDIRNAAHRKKICQIGRAHV